jgi:hypothetical protein
MQGILKTCFFTVKPALYTMFLIDLQSAPRSPLRRSFLTLSRWDEESSLGQDRGNSSSSFVSAAMPSSSSDLKRSHIFKFCIIANNVSDPDLVGSVIRKATRIRIRDSELWALIRFRIWILTILSETEEMSEKRFNTHI